MLCLTRPRTCTTRIRTIHITLNPGAYIKRGCGGKPGEERIIRRSPEDRVSESLITISLVSHRHKTQRRSPRIRIHRIFIAVYREWRICLRFLPALSSTKRTQQPWIIVFHSMTVLALAKYGSSTWLFCTLLCTYKYEVAIR